MSEKQESFGNIKKKTYNVESHKSRLNHKNIPDGLIVMLVLYKANTCFLSTYTRSY